MVKYMPIDNKDEDSILQLYVTIDHVLQFEESQEPREPQNCDNFSEQD